MHPSLIKTFRPLLRCDGFRYLHPSRSLLHASHETIFRMVDVTNKALPTRGNALYRTVFDDLTFLWLLSLAIFCCICAMHCDGNCNGKYSTRGTSLIFTIFFFGYCDCRRVFFLCFSLCTFLLIKIIIRHNRPFTTIFY